MKRACLAGATGLVGGYLLQKLLSDESYTSVQALTRRPLTFHHPKLRNLVINFDDLEIQSPHLQADEVFCCLGTTIRKAGSEQAFRKVDYEYPIKLARVAKQAGANAFFLVSALGADKNSWFFYNRIKSETEEGIIGMGFDRTHIFRPSLLLGPRSEKRAGEDAAKVFFQFFGWMVPVKYRAIHAEKVARAMLFHAAQKQNGVFVHESWALQDF